MQAIQVRQANLGKFLIGGIVGGLAGGVVFEMLMAIMGMLTVIASMVGSDSAIVGFGIHMMISAFIGAIG